MDHGRFLHLSRGYVTAPLWSQNSALSKTKTKTPGKKNQTKTNLSNDPTSTRHTSLSRCPCHRPAMPRHPPHHFRTTTTARSSKTPPRTNDQMVASPSPVHTPSLRMIISTRDETPAFAHPCMTPVSQPAWSKRTRCQEVPSIKIFSSSLAVTRPLRSRENRYKKKREPGPRAVARLGEDTRERVRILKQRQFQPFLYGTI